jgi:hypothetical protein
MHNDEPLRFGYTLGDVAAATTSALQRSGPMGSGYAERYEVAWPGVVEHLYSAETAPTFWELAFAGQQAIRAWLTQNAHAHGVGPRRGRDHNPDMPRAAMYWLDIHTVPSPENSVVERLALTQSLAQLPADEREALLATAAHGSGSAAARALGVEERRFNKVVTRARRAVEASWLAGETPVRRALRPRRTNGLRPCGTASAYIRHRRRGESQDEECIRAWNEYKHRNREASPP